MSTKYRIFSAISGTPYGVYQGTSPVDALAALHRDAGYPCHVEDGEIVGYTGRRISRDGANFVGELDTWRVEAVDPETSEETATTPLQGEQSITATVYRVHADLDDGEVWGPHPVEVLPDGRVIVDYGTEPSAIWPSLLHVDACDGDKVSGYEVTDETVEYTYDQLTEITRIEWEYYGD